MKRITVYTDGASRGNPGEAGIGVVIYDEAQRVLMEVSEYIGKTTNNVAEYKAVIRALESGLELGAESVQLKSDSELLVRQLLGMYKVRNEGLKPLYKEVLSLLSQYKRYSIEHIPREENSYADKLANKGIDSKN